MGVLVTLSPLLSLKVGAPAPPLVVARAPALASSVARAEPAITPCVVRAEPATTPCVVGVPTRPLLFARATTPAPFST
ncbi:hypothetical protein PF005_g33714 [Phytophthora fragariae]|uniref:RxLR effector protein n=1 Tax=Phytophthora fragariae TaxID=53985 RepID=A0A6A3DBB1_9STRA|nr:hypothetical protein PF003_g28660 [Phytophthora fragariae]KAE8916211.1 hypothetical protein PF009_g33463 [Phytophthora fragariae]KAE9058331.1 hypothetical protein PF007_g31339 [Phytophthora fragariae]KAE9062476.1 hypothetical protein PF006_g31158 [Phytophthora fragariae]KAE9068981.1 hypothetical protein PF010_g26839 [Phytophthora fragariae]